MIDVHSSVQPPDKLKDVRGALAAAWTQRVFGIVGQFLSEIIDFNGNKLQLCKDLDSVRLEVSMVPISTDGREPLSARDDWSHQPQSDARSAQQRTQRRAAKANSTSHLAAGSKESGFDRKLDMAIAHLLLDSSTHPLYQCHVDEAVDSTSIETNVDNHLEAPLLALLDKVKAHQHLAPDNFHTVGSALIDSWSERVGSRLDEAIAAMDHSSGGSQHKRRRTRHSTPALQSSAGADTGLPAHSPVEDGASDSDYDDTRTSQTPGGDGNAFQPESSLDVRGNKKRQSKTKSQRINPGSRAPVKVRRPTGSGTYYSYTTTKAAWAAMDWKRQGVLSHMGRIEETDEGMVATEVCSGCKDNSCDKCMIYTEEARLKYFSYRAGFGCAHCRFSGRGCSFQQPATSARKGKRRRMLVDAENEIDSLKAQLAARAPQQSGSVGC
ncbi:hypothetical protein LTR85_010361 [Meristemomyces frigidus]|nr:hypothetical protein LTR85_010361 [Meristemomyces frigidus]